MIVPMEYSHLMASNRKVMFASEGLLEDSGIGRFSYTDQISTIITETKKYIYPEIAVTYLLKV